MTDMETTATTPEFTAYAVGLVCASACTRLTDEETTRRLNWERPTGVAPWRISSDDHFANGSPMPGPCEFDARNRHLLFEC